MPITADDIQEIAGSVPDSVIEGFASVLGLESSRADGMDIDDQPTRSKNFDGVRSKVKELVKNGYSGSQVLSQVNPLFVRIPF